jgi:hypothetical protein
MQVNRFHNPLIFADYSRVNIVGECAYKLKLYLDIDIRCLGNVSGR